MPSHACHASSLQNTQHIPPRAQMVLIDAFDGELICEYPVQEQGECPEYEHGLIWDIWMSLIFNMV